MYAPNAFTHGAAEEMGVLSGAIESYVTFGPQPHYVQVSLCYWCDQLQWSKFLGVLESKTEKKRLSSICLISAWLVKAWQVLGVYTENCTAVFVVQGMFRRLLFANKMVTLPLNVSIQLI